MTFDENITACAQMVERGDPYRFRTVMAAPLSARPVLFALYAFNLEVARAPWVTQEPMIAEMRLQWWRDVLEEIQTGKTPRRHEVVTPLSQILSPGDAVLLDEMVAARRWDIYKDAFDDQAHFERYIDHTAGNLMGVALRRLGGEISDPLRDLAYGAGVAAWLCAVPKLEEAKRIPLLDGRAEGIQSLAQSALVRWQKGQKNLGKLKGPAHAAIWPALGAQKTLAQVIKDPNVVAQGHLQMNKPNLLWITFKQWMAD